MKTKRCNKCGEVKPVSEFGKEGRALNGYKPRCKDCTNEYYRSIYPSISANKIRTVKRYYRKHKMAISIKSKEYYERTKKRKSSYNKAYKVRNRDVLNIKANQREKLRVKTDDEYRLLKNMRKLIYRTCHNKTNRTEIMLGFGRDELIQALGRAPTRGESVDHRVPVSWFVTGTDTKIINHLSNLQILGRSQNSKKNNSYADIIDFKYYLLVRDFIQPKYQNKLRYGNEKDSLARTSRD